jgi:hypothetical protein
LVIAFFQELLTLDEPVFRKFVQKLVDVVAQLVECDSVEVRHGSVGLWRRGLSLGETAAV